jgi:autotransporter-associated beta strand protein
LAGTDVENSALTYTVVTPPANGSLSGIAPNVTYTPSANFNGADSFTFTVNDGTVDSTIATVSISVTPVNDAPEAIAQSTTTNEDTFLPITLAGTDFDLNSLSYTIVSPPVNGILSGTAPNLTYTPSANFNGADSFTFIVNDGTVDSAIATVSISVTPANDVPVAIAQSITGSEDTALPVVLAGTDVDLETLNYVIVSQPANGTLNGTAPNLSFTPAADFNGADSFSFIVNDGTVDSAIATIAISLAAVNDVPVAVAQTLATDEDTALAIILTGTDVDQETLTYSIVTPPANGTLSGTAPNVTYIPTANYNGSDSFTFAANDGTVDSATAAVSITVTSINDAPVFAVSPFATANGSEGVSYVGQTVAGRASDVDAGDTLTYSKVSGPTWLAVAANGALTGTPPPGSAGLNVFGIRATDSASATADGILQITITSNTLTWDANGTGANRTDGAGAWLTANQWWNGTSNQSWASSSIATFGNGGAGGAVSLASPTTVNQIVFNAFTGTYTLGTTTQTITLSSGITKNTGTGNATIISPITLGGAQTWTNHTGGLTITRGVNTGGNRLTIAGNGIVVFNTASGIISGSGGVTMNGSDRFFLSDPTTGPHTYTGTTVINSGITLVHNNNLGSGNLVLNGGVFEAAVNHTFIRALGTGSGQIQITGGASGFGQNANQSSSVIFGNNANNEAVWGSAVFNPSILVLQTYQSQGTSSINLQNKIDLNGSNRTVQVSGGTVGNASATISGVIRNSTGTAGLIKTGAGRLILSAANTYNGDTTVNAGTLQINSPNTGNDGSTISIAAGATLNLNFTGSETVARLFVGGTQLSPGVYGPGNIVNPRITGTGTLTVTLPLPWVAADLGTGMLSGFTTFSAGTFTQAGAGTIGSTADKLSFTYQTLSGDGEITARISALQDTGSLSRVGVMIRDSLAPNSKQILMGMSGANTYVWDQRTDTAGTTTSTASGTGTVPNTWLRLVRSGTTITAFTSADGSTWNTVGSTTDTTFASTCYIGLAVSSGSDGTRNTSQFNNVSVTP